MRVYILSFMILFLVNSCATTNVSVPLADNYEQIIEVPGASKEELYSRVNSWFVETFNSAESVIEFQDKEIGKVMGKYVWRIKDSFGNIFSYRNVISVEVKEGRSRIKFYDPSMVKKGHWKPVSTYAPSTYRYQMDKFFIPKWEAMSRTLESRIRESDDW